MLLKHSDDSVQQMVMDVCREHGAEAETFATNQMDDFMARDDAKQASFWMAVLHEIKRLPSSSVN